MRPAEMALLLDSPLVILLVWIIWGVLSLFVAMVVAEVGAMMPETGGQYFFMRKMYGDFWVYLYGWANFSVINTAGTAGVAFICSQYVEYFFKLPKFSNVIEQSFKIHLPFIGTILPLENIGVKLLTILLLVVLTFISYRSTKTGGIIQVVFTAAKILAIVLLVGGLFFYENGSVKNFTTTSATIKPIGFALIAAIIAACNGALQAYDGWGNMVNVAGEIKNPQKNIPKSLGIFICTNYCLIMYIVIFNYYFV